MPVLLETRQSDFEESFTTLLATKRETSDDVNATVSEILKDLCQRGDEALISYTSKFDRVAMTSAELAFSASDLEKAGEEITDETKAALQLAHDRIADFHARQRPESTSYTDEMGVRLGSRWTAVAAAGLYVPGGLASYPSSVLMNAVPAKVAGVERLVMTVPTPGGVINPLVLWAAKIAGIDEIYKVGGAQAIGALAYGTQTIAPVDTIVGPGNAYVAAAKRQVFGTVGIDMIAGPSEVLVVADAQNDPAWIAADLLAQAEHDAVAQSILITDDKAFAARVATAVDHQLKTLPRAEIASASWHNFGAMIIVEDLDDAPALVDRLAPEHLELAVEDPEGLFARIRNAGAAFLGRHTPEAVGDYVAGPNHVLPTARSARFSSGLSVLDFMKRTSIIQCDPASLSEIGPAAVTLAKQEGLDAHAHSVSIRMNKS